MNNTQGFDQPHRKETPERHLRWWPLVAVTTANYVWQVPYAVHHYRAQWAALPRFSIPLILTGIWFAIAVTAAARGRRYGRTSLAAYLVTEVCFYVIHNATGALGADLRWDNPVLFVASVLGYVSAATAAVYLVLMFRSRDSLRTGGSIRRE